jgi:DNA-binding NarL/FixJ family response regulator
MAHRLQPDVVLMNVRMPDMDGVTATRQLLEEGESDPDQLVKVIILMTYHIDEAVYSALRAGASVFVLRCRAR